MQMCLRNAIKIGLLKITKLFRNEIFEEIQSMAKNTVASTYVLTFFYVI